MFTAKDYSILASIAFEDGYKGFKPEIKEIPNGDGNIDQDKRFSHIATKYIDKGLTTIQANIVLTYLERANNKATEVAIELGVPREFWPSLQFSTIRILEYPPGAGCHHHTDFDLFTLMLYRNTEENFHFISPPHSDFMKDKEEYNRQLNLGKAMVENKQIHFGELLPIIMPKAYSATVHYVDADCSNRTQYSMIYFAIPDWDAVLPDGQKVGDWLEERYSRSRIVLDKGYS